MTTLVTIEMSKVTKRLQNLWHGRSRNTAIPVTHWSVTNHLEAKRRKPHALCLAICGFEEFGGDSHLSCCGLEAGGHSPQRWLSVLLLPET